MSIHPSVRTPGLTPDRIAAYCIGSYLMRRDSSKLNDYCQRLIVKWLTSLSDRYIKVLVIGDQHRLDRTKTTIYAPVPHTSHIDHTAVIRATGLSLPMINIGAAKDYFFDKPQIAYFFKNVLNTIPINRDNSGIGLGECGNALRSGQNLLLYPEGGREKEGKPFDLYDGVFYLTIRCKVCLSPIIIRGAQKVLPAGAWIPRPGIIEVEFLQPFTPNDYCRTDLKQEVQKLRDAFLGRVSPYWKPATLATPPRD